jgi:antitoxin StbD
MQRLAAPLRFLKFGAFHPKPRTKARSAQNWRLIWSQFMEAIYSDITISMSEFKKNPAAVLRNAQGKPVVVLNHNKAAFYMIEPALFESMLEELSGQDLHCSVLSRVSERSRAIEVDIDAI